MIPAFTEGGKEREGLSTLARSCAGVGSALITIITVKCVVLLGQGLSLIHIFVVLLSFLFVDMFDTIGTLIGVSDKAGMLDKEGKLPRVKNALLADAIATSAGAVLGLSLIHI